MRDGVRLSVDLIRPDNVTEIPRVSESSEYRHGICGTGDVSKTVDIRDYRETHDYLARCR